MSDEEARHFMERFPTEILLRTIKDRRNTQTRVAGAYAAAMQENENVDWGEVNAAIITRWSKSGLNRVKRMAWATAARLYPSGPLFTGGRSGGSGGEAR